MSELTERGTKNGATFARAVVGGGTGRSPQPSSPRSVSPSTDAMSALNRARRAWQRTQQQTQLDLDGLDETHADITTIPPPGGRARPVEPEGSPGSGASPTPAIVSESSPPLTAGSSFRQGACEAAASRAPGSRHLHVVPDPRVPMLIPLPRLLEVLSWKP